MALDPLDKWEKRLLSMGQSKSVVAGSKELANFYGDMGDKVQAGAAGKEGIFTFNKEIFATQLMSMGFGPEPSSSVWAAAVANAWNNAVGLSIIKPGTVSNPIWTASSVDSLTLPIGSATITTASAAKGILMAGLIASSPAFKTDSKKGIKLMAKAFYDATKLFSFLTIGLVITPGGPVPAPIPTEAK